MTKTFKQHLKELQTHLTLASPHPSPNSQQPPLFRYNSCHFERSREVFDLSRSRLRSTTAKTHNLSLIIQNPLLLRVPQQRLYLGG